MDDPSPSHSLSRGLAVIVVLAAFALAILGLVALTTGPGDDLLARYYPQQIGHTALYRATYGDGVPGWVAFNQVHADEVYSAQLLTLGAQPLQQDSVWINSGGVDGLVQRRSDAIGNDGYWLAQTALRFAGQAPLFFSPPLTFLSRDLLAGADTGVITGVSTLPNGVTLALTRTVAGRETVTVPAGTFPDALRLVDVSRLGTLVQRVDLWLASGQGMVRSETWAADGSLVERLELVRANFGPAAEAGSDHAAPELPMPGRGATAHSGQGPARTHAVPFSQPVETLHLWWSHRNRSSVGGSAVGGDGLIYFIDHAGVVTAQEAISGAVRWRFSTGNASGATPALANGVLYVGSGDKRLYALDAATGLFLWSFSTLDAITASPLATGKRVYVASGDRSLYALDAASGRLLWERRATAALEAAPALLGSTLVIADGGGVIYALDAADGSIRWQAAAGSGVTATPALDGRQVFVAARDFVLYAFDLDSGDEQWRLDTEGIVLGGIAVGPDAVYIADDSGRVYGIDRHTGQERWRVALENGYAVGAALLLGNALIVATQEGEVAVLDAANGQQRTAFVIDDESFTSTPWWDETTQRVVLPGTSGYVHVFTSPSFDEVLAPPRQAGPLTLHALWEASIGRITQGPLTRQAGMLYHVSSDGVLTAFDAETGQAHTVTETLGPLQAVSPRPGPDGRLAFIGNLNGDLQAIDLETGQPVWSTHVGDAVWFDALPDGDSVFVHALTGASSGRLLRLDAADGQVVWQTELPGPGSSAPVAWAGRIIVAAGQVTSLDRATGQVVWTAPFGPVTGALAVGADGTVYASDGQNWAALDGETGAVLWQATATAQAGARPPAIDAAGAVLVAGLSDGLHGFNLADGHERWQFATDWPTLSGVTVSEGIAYATASNGQLYAVGAADGTLRTGFWPGGTSVSGPAAPLVSGDRLYYVQGLDLLGLEIRR